LELHLYLGHYRASKSRKELINHIGAELASQDAYYLIIMGVKPKKVWRKAWRRNTATLSLKPIARKIHAVTKCSVQAGHTSDLKIVHKRLNARSLGVTPREIDIF